MQGTLNQYHVIDILKSLQRIESKKVSVRDASGTLWTYTIDMHSFKVHNYRHIVSWDQTDIIGCPSCHSKAYMRVRK